MVAGFLIEQTWQISMVFGFVLVACWILRNASAHWRYLLWLVVIGKCLMPPMVTVHLPLLPSEEVMTPITIVTESPSPIGTADFESSIEIAKTPSQVTQETESVSREFANASSATNGPTILPHTSYNLSEWLVTAWLLIVGVLIVQVAGRMWLTHRRLQHTCQPADAETQVVVVALAETLGMKRTPFVHMADSIAQPFVWGWLRGDVYLPKQFPETGTVEQRRAILMHELAHVLRWDAAVNHLQNVVQAVFFFHPLIWWTNQKIRQEREKCCDEIVLSASGTQPRIYCEAIVEMLAQEYTSRQSTPALAVTGSIKNVKERITTMLTPNRKFCRRPSRAAVVTMLLVAACVLPTALVMTPQIGNAATQDETAKSNAVANSKDIKPAKISTWAAGQTLDFRVINADTKEPIPDVTLELQGIAFEDVKIPNTNADGWSRIPLPDMPPEDVRVYPKKEGFVPLRVYWAAEPHPTMPKSITISMEPGKKFGGIVRNEAGEPIPDVTVTTDFGGAGKGENPHIRANINTKTTTDKDGRWLVDVMPAEIDDVNKLRIYLHHPEYLSDHLRKPISPIPVTERPPLDQLFNQSSVMVMRKGETIEGTVVDGDGKPIPNASIYDNIYYWFDPDKTRATTDENGKFRITGVEFSPNQIDSRQRDIEPDGFSDVARRPRRGIILTVRATGYAHELIFANPASSPLEVQLDAGESIHGQVVDENGIPLEGVRIDAIQWREQPLRLHLESMTDVDGKFELKNVPTDEVKYNIGKDGYMSVSEFPMIQSSNEYKVVLKAPVRIIGLVTDAETGAPLEKFSLMPGIARENGGATDWIRWFARTIVNEGRYETRLIQEKEGGWVLRVAAEGYMPAISRIFRPYDPDKGEITYDFKLTKAPPLTGVVLGLDDKPLANADVYLATDRMNIDKRKVTSTEVPPVKTDAEGRFLLPPEVEPFYIVVVHEQGIGMITEADCETPPTITIKPWESVKDQLQIIRKPAGMHSDFP